MASQSEIDKVRRAKEALERIGIHRPTAKDINGHDPSVPVPTVKAILRDHFGYTSYR